MLPEIQPAEQPGDGDSSENVVSDLGSPSNAANTSNNLIESSSKLIHATSDQQKKGSTKDSTRVGSKPQSTFAKALANKKSSSNADQEPTQNAGSNLVESSNNPFTTVKLGPSDSHENTNGPMQ